jgi:hypothetical protein
MLSGPFLSAYDLMVPLIVVPLIVVSLILFFRSLGDDVRDDVS